MKKIQPCVVFPAIYRLVMKKDGYSLVRMALKEGVKWRRASSKL